MSHPITNTDRRSLLRRLAVMSGAALVLPMVLPACKSDEEDKVPRPIAPTPTLSFRDLPAIIRYVSGFVLNVEWNSRHVEDMLLEYKSQASDVWIALFDGKANIGQYLWSIQHAPGTYLLRATEKVSGRELTLQSIEFVRLVGYVHALNTTPELQTIGGITFLNTNLLGGLAIRRDTQNSFTVLSSVCTHEGCTIDVSLSSGWICYCHGSTFDPQGLVTNGPADRSLPVYQTEYFASQNTLIITE